jgi:outer membrane protein OmpA-like peptidoglycan-associated protein
MTRAQSSLLGTVCFDGTVSKLTRASWAPLTKRGKVLKATGLGPVGVRGNTGTRGPSRHQQRLSRERAGKLRTFLESDVKGLIPSVGVLRASADQERVLEAETLEEQPVGIPVVKEDCSAAGRRTHP